MNLTREQFWTMMDRAERAAFARIVALSAFMWGTLQ